MSSGGCGKPGHVTAGSDEGTQWCATCVTEENVVEELWEKHGQLMTTIECDVVGERTVVTERDFAKAIDEALERAAQEAANPFHADATRDLRDDIARRIRALKTQKAPQ